MCGWVGACVSPWCAPLAVSAVDGPEGCPPTRLQAYFVDRLTFLKSVAVKDTSTLLSVGRLVLAGLGEGTLAGLLLSTSRCVPV